MRASRFYALTEQAYEVTRGGQGTPDALPLSLKLFAAGCHHYGVQRLLTEHPGIRVNGTHDGLGTVSVISGSRSAAREHQNNG